MPKEISNLTKKAGLLEVNILIHRNELYKRADYVLGLACCSKVKLDRELGKCICWTVCLCVEKGIIVVGDGCWRRNVSLTTIRCW